MYHISILHQFDVCVNIYLKILKEGFIMNFSENLKELRNKVNLSREELADKLNIGKGAIRDWEQGIKQPLKLEILEKLKEVLSCSYDDLLK